MSEFILAMPFVLHSTMISQQNGKSLRYDSSRLCPKSVLTTFLLYLVLILKYLSNSSCRHWSCSQRALRSAQSDSPRLVTALGLSLMTNNVWPPQLSQNSNPTETTAETAISAATKHIRLLNANLAFQKGLLQGERVKEQIQIFLLGLWDSLL